MRCEISSENKSTACANSVSKRLKNPVRFISTPSRRANSSHPNSADAFYGAEDANLYNVDVMTDASMPASVFTRYTVAPSTASRTSKYGLFRILYHDLPNAMILYRRSSRSKRKLERKAGSGRKGTVDEEEYLLKSVSKLVGRFNTTQGRIFRLPHPWCR
jgi:hypothetical protein